jgi:hypothetical protein
MEQSIKMVLMKQTLAHQQQVKIIIIFVFTNNFYIFKSEIASKILTTSSSSGSYVQVIIHIVQ